MKLILKKTKVRDIKPGDRIIIGGKAYKVERNDTGYLTTMRRTIHLMKIGCSHWEESITITAASLEKFKVDKTHRKTK